MADAQGCIDYSIKGTLILNEGSYRGPVSEVVTYYTIIANRDLYNSSGTRLADFRAIIQQDRSNLHKSGIADKIYDTFDDGSPNIMAEDFDGYFTTLNRRTMLSTDQYYQHCSDSIPNSILEKRIVQGKVMAAMLQVTVFRHPNGNLAVLLAPVG